MNNNHEIQFENLRERIEETKERKEEFSNFSSLILGLILGAVIATPLNLILDPVTYQEGDLVYGPVTLMKSAPWWIVPVISILLLFLLITAVLFLYVIWIDLLGKENVTISYIATSDEKFARALAEYLAEKGRLLEMNVKYEMGIEQGLLQKFLPSGSESEIQRAHVIRCSDPRRELAYRFINLPARTSPLSGFFIYRVMNRFYPKTVLELHFESQSGEIEVAFDPNNENCIKLLNGMENEFT